MSGNDSNTMLLCHFDGTNGSTTFTDVAAGGPNAPHTITAVGSGAVSVTQSEFGGASLHCSLGNYATITSAADLVLGNGPFTVDFWFYIDLASIEGVPYSLIGNVNGSGGTSTWGIGIHSTTGGPIFVENDNNVLNSVISIKCIAALGLFH